MKLAILSVFLLAVYSAYSEEVLECEPGEHKYGNSCYQFHPPKTFWSAQYECFQADGDLVSIHSFAENEFVAGFGEEVMIGYYDINGSYAWTDRTFVNFTNLDPNFMHWKDYFGYCTKIVNGIWKNMDCDLDKVAFVCKTSAKSFPVTQKDQCPDADEIHTDNGSIYSPGYPEYYDGTHELKCAYKIASRIGTTVQIFFDKVELMSAEDTIKVYNSWTPSEENLLGIVYSGAQYTSFQSSKNFLLVQFEGVTTGVWEANFKTAMDMPTTAWPWFNYTTAYPYYNYTTARPWTNGTDYPHYNYTTYRPWTNSTDYPYYNYTTYRPWGNNTDYPYSNYTMPTLRPWNNGTDAPVYNGTTWRPWGWNDTEPSTPRPAGNGTYITLPPRGNYTARLLRNRLHRRRF